MKGLEVRLLEVYSLLVVVNGLTDLGCGGAMGDTGSVSEGAVFADERRESSGEDTDAAFRPLEELPLWS